MDADRNLAMKGAATRLLTSVIDRAVAAAETGRLLVVLDFHRGQLNKAAGVRQLELGSVVDAGDGRLVEKTAR